jgi:hypothetical protein
MHCNPNYSCGRHGVLHERAWEFVCADFSAYRISNSAASRWVLQGVPMVAEDGSVPIYNFRGLGAVFAFLSRTRCFSEDMRGFYYPVLPRAPTSCILQRTGCECEYLRLLWRLHLTPCMTASKFSYHCLNLFNWPLVFVSARRLSPGHRLLTENTISITLTRGII